MRITKQKSYWNSCQLLDTLRPSSLPLNMPLSINQSRFTLLVVDDEPNVLAAFRRHLKSHPIELYTTNSAAEASKILDDKIVHVLLADYRMPDIDGIEFCKISKERWPATIRIILSGQLDLPKAQAKVTPDLIFNFMVKPWQDLELIVELENAFEEWRLRSTLLTLKEESEGINAEEAETKRRLDEMANLRSQRVLLSQKLVEQKNNQLRFLINLNKNLSSDISKNSFEEFLQKEAELLLQNSNEDILNEITPQINLAREYLKWLLEIRADSAELGARILTPVKELISFMELFAEEFREEGVKNEFLNLKDALSQFLSTFGNFAQPIIRENLSIHTEINLNEIVRRSLALLKDPINKAGVTTVLNLKQHIPNIVGNMEALQRVFCNLIANALKTMENGGILTIETKCDGKRFVCLTITDNGKGIISSALTTIFDPLSNMNLAPSQAIIKEHKGNILISTKKGEGTKRTVLIPQAGGTA